MKILFYPKGPRGWNKITDMIHHDGWEATNNSFEDFDAAINWSGKAYHAMPETLRVLEQSGKKIINLHCNDVRKSTVDRIFQEVYGYSSLVNPTTYHGKMVEKSEKQAAHDGRIITGPIKKAKADHIYQVLIDNEIEKGIFRDIRVIVFKNQIPFVFLKQKNEIARFTGGCSYASIVKGNVITEFLPEGSLEKIIQFINKIGLEYGEIDILYDHLSKKHYIIDVNKTPGNGIFKVWPANITKDVLNQMCELFKSELT